MAPIDRDPVPIGPGSGRVEPAVAGDPGGKGRGPQDVGDITGVGGVASECDAPTALDDLGVATHSSDPLAETQVRPRDREHPGRSPRRC